MASLKDKKDMINLSRRSFLISSASTSAVMAFAPTTFANDISAKQAIANNIFSPSIWFEMNSKGDVLINIAKAEMGQHIGTALARILADELGCDWEQVTIKHVDADPKWGYMVTGGSWSVFQSYKPLSQAGAAGRIALIEAASTLLNVAPERCHTQGGFVIAGEKRISFGEILTRRELNRTFTVEELEALPIKPTNKQHLIGQQSQALDIPPKTNGTAVYGIDVEVDGMVYARPVLPPTHLGSKVTRVDDTAAKKIKGYLGYEILKDPSDTCQGWVTAIAATYPAAIKAADALNVEYIAGDTANVTEAMIQAEGERIVRDRNEGMLFKDHGNVSTAQRDAKTVIEATYTTATASHFQLEPLNALVEFKGDTCHIHTGCQWQSLSIPTLAKAAGVSEDKLKMHQYFLGGGFGRRLFADWAVPAILTAKAIGKPVKLIFTRPDDTIYDQCRSASTALFHASIDANGKFTGLEHALAAGWPTKAMAPGFMPESLDKKGHFDPFSTSGADHWYSMDNHRARAINNTLAQKTFTPGWLRSVGQGWILWGLESFIDEVAVATNQDPVAFRIAMLDGKGDNAGKAPESVGGAKRLRHVMEKLQAKVANITLGPDEGIGFSASAGQERTMPAWIAKAAHVHVDRNSGKITVKKLYAVIDAGIVVHPDGALAQIEGSLLWGTSLALHEFNRFDKGRVSATNLHQYYPLRMNDLPALDIEFIDSDEFPVGLGEPGVIGVAPAIGNAVYNAVGVRLRDLPMTSEQVIKALNA